MKRPKKEKKQNEIKRVITELRNLGTNNIITRIIIRAALTDQT